jgi:uncharacterized protein (TIGR02594 family)
MMGARTFRVTASVLNGRSSPHAHADGRNIVCRIPRDSYLVEQDERGDWTFVVGQATGGRAVWVASRYLAATGDHRWLETARAELNVAEIPGPRAEARIVEYHLVTSLKASSDEVPWCASFVSWVLEQNGIRSTRSARAADYLTWGREVHQPRPGTVVVFSRTGGSGHVAFYLRDLGSEVEVLGGNQGNRVCVARFPKSRLLAYREPAT